ncbi:MAG: hypothetical protein ACRYFU_00470 [Janthinobacterium lividum]
MKTLAQIGLAFVAILLLPLFLVLRLFGWRPGGQADPQTLFPHEPQGYAMVSASEGEIHPYPFIYVENEGGARELSRREREYLETPFIAPDGARPYAKWRYKEKNGWGELSGFLKRNKLPRGTPIAPAPLNEPERAAKSETIRRAREYGADIVENDDGSYTIIPSTMFRSGL